MREGGISYDNLIKGDHHTPHPDSYITYLGPPPGTPTPPNILLS